MTSNNIPRVTQQIFTGNAPIESLAVFGSMRTGNPVYTNNVTTLTGSSAYGEGFQEAIQDDKAPYLEETNGLFYGITSQLAYLFQKGIPEWDADTQYFTNSFCQYNGVIYQSTIDNNINLIPTANAQQWTSILTTDLTPLQNEIALLKLQMAQLQQQMANLPSQISWAPNWSGKISRSLNTDYTADTSGFIVAYRKSPSGNSSLVCYVNGVEVQNMTTHGLSGAYYGVSFTIPVAKGDVYRITGQITNCWFVPVGS